MARAQASAPAKAPTDGRVQVTLVRGTFDDRDADGLPVSYGPGSTIDVVPEDAEMLKRIGLVKPDDYVDPEEVQDGTLKISATSGPTVTSIG